MLEKVVKVLKESENIVFFGGAGVSTESGIPDFRSADGLYNKKFKYPPEKMLSRSFFHNNPEAFYDFYKAMFDCRKYEPNVIHKALAKMEQEGRLLGIITQNVDGLHTKAGSKNVIEVHGTIYANYCNRRSCGEQYDTSDVFDTEGVPRCSKCGAIIRPDIVLYEEQIKKMNEAEDLIKKADVLIIAGTSLNVYPAASLVTEFIGTTLIILNKEPLNSVMLGPTDYFIPGEMGKVFSLIY